MIEIKRATAHDLKLDEQGSITLAFAQLGVVDSDGDVTLPGAFPTKDVPMSAYGHSSWEGALPVGRGTISEQGSWAVFAGQFLMETGPGRDAYHTVKAMAELQQYSYGYLPVEYSFGEHDGQRVRFLKRLDVFEVSPVLVGAGLGTHTMSIKSGGPGPGLPYADHLEGLLKEVAVFVDRSRERAGFRAKEGRVLSAATRDRLVALLDALGTARSDLEALLADTEPPKSRIDREIAALAEIARFHGVPIG
jgi:hypothetical protein